MKDTAFEPINRSVNEVICHGIPDTRPLKDGDILNIDITVYKVGWNKVLFLGEKVCPLPIYKF